MILADALAYSAKYDPEIVIDAAKSADKENKKGKKQDAVMESADDPISTIDSSSCLPEEELIKRQDWSCYGSTQIDYLLLKNPERKY